MNVSLVKERIEEKESLQEQNRLSEKEKQIMCVAEKCLSTAKLYSFIKE